MLSVLAALLFSSSAFAMPQSSYDSLVRQVDGESFSDDQLTVLRTAASANTFSPRQAAGLLNEFSFSSDQLSALRILAPRLEAGDNSVILSAFSFSSDQEEAQGILASARPAPQPAPQPFAQPMPAPVAQPSAQSRRGGFNLNVGGVGISVNNGGRAAPAPRSSPGVTNKAPTGQAAPQASTLSPSASTLSPSAMSCPLDASLPALALNWSSTWSDADMTSLLAELRDEAFSDRRMDILRRRIDSRPDALTGGQVVQILHTFDFSNDLEIVAGVVDDNLLGMTVTEISGILEAYTFSDGKLAALRVFKDTITDVEHKAQLLESFTFSADKTEAARILEGVTPRSFLFGTVHSQRAVFVVDTSGSMEATFRTNQGRSMSRLDFVRCELNTVLTQQLGPTSQFSIVTFSDDANPWRRELVGTAGSAIPEAQTYVAGARPRGATNIEAALRSAQAMNPDVIYFLTDGAPTAGAMRKANDLTALAQQGGDTIHAIAFLTGDHRADNKGASRELMRAMAEATGGVYRAIE
ncbi:MAG: Mg-chelatase subunit ChlD [Myxococcota bacterium]|jgi:Mg-chelatase subunit ChlD